MPKPIKVVDVVVVVAVVVFVVVVVVVVVDPSNVPLKFGDIDDIKFVVGGIQNHFHVRLLLLSRCFCNLFHGL